MSLLSKRMHDEKRWGGRRQAQRDEILRTKLRTPILYNLALTTARFNEELLAARIRILRENPHLAEPVSWRGRGA